ncbi:MAG: EAL domain-containing protein [Gammaproteobacteria bacterium]|nr:EAL domain-containing protein [Gammaproteobacteria bacterium]NND36343.1 EAL domain-containing protein [Gammaproteobacteria bacterium]
MDGGFEKDQTIRDYVAMLEALLPEAVGFYFVDRKAAVFFEQPPRNRVDFTAEYDTAVREVLEAPERADELGRITLGAVDAVLLPLVGEAAKLLGSVTLLIDGSSELTREEIEATTRPAIDSLVREFLLRYRLITSYKKLNVRSAEENLLHQVEKLVHSRRSCDETLSHMLLLCRKFLNVRGAALLIPEKHVRLFEGDTLSPVEARLLLSDMAEPVPYESYFREGEAQPGDEVRTEMDGDVLALPVRHDSHEPVGILVLSGWAQSNFSGRRRRRIGRYLVAHVEDVIARDYDALTGLMSWQLFETKLLGACDPDDRKAGTENIVFFCDIDQFHVVNDSLGPEVADEILAVFARMLRDRMGRHLVTRISGDTFAALMLETDLEAAREQANELVEAFGTVERARGDQTLRFSVSIGIAPVSGQPSTGSAAIAPAQVACRAAKDRGRGRVESYQQGDASIIQRLDDIQLVGHIRYAIENKRILIAAQPIVPLKEDNERHYYEVLTRLINADGAPVPPAEFFSAAERYHLMEELDRLVISETFATLSSRLEGFQNLPFRIAINLSGQSLGSEQFLPFVQQQIAESGIPAEMLCFEITETVAVANLQRAQTFMHTLKKIGCNFSLDDFGTGLSSFAYLKMFPVDTLKIDGSFVRDLSTNVVSQSVVAAISEVARVMELETVAEYVEDEDAKTLLRDLGVTYGQGFLLGEPEPLAGRLDSLISSVEAEQISA